MYKRWNKLWRELPETNGNWTIHADLSGISSRHPWSYPSYTPGNCRIYYFTSLGGHKHYSQVAQSWMAVCVQRMKNF